MTRTVRCIPIVFGTILSFTKFPSLKTELNWNQKVNKSTIHWKSVWSNIHKSRCHDKCKEIQRKFIHNVILQDINSH